MAVKFGKFEMPSKIIIESESQKDNSARFVSEPWEKGYAHTLGNCYRRTLLLSMEAPAIISVRLQGVKHEYTPVDGIVEDMTNIVLNLKGALLRRLPKDDEHYSRESRILSTMIDVTQSDLDKNKGQVVVRLGDIVDEGLFEVVNPELAIFTVTQPMKRQIDLRVAFGRGYVPTERLDVRDKSSDEILIDASFSPVRLVNYIVENTRVGQDTDYDKLILDVVTDGRITPLEALSFATQISMKHFEVFSKFKPVPITFDEGLEGAEGDEDDLLDKLLLRIDEIELSVRSTNCLSGANIETIAELVSIPERKMLEFRNFGKKSLNEIKAKLTDMNLSLGMDLSRFGITAENVKEKVKYYYEERKRNRERMREENEQNESDDTDSDDNDDLNDE
jgi:DNA-directed RNA polymerase subunit alpha